MKRLLPAATALAVVFAFAVSCSEHAVLAKGPVDAASMTTSLKVDNFRLIDADGRAHDLYRLKDAKAIVIATTMVGASDVAKLAPELEKVRAAYGPQGVEFLALNSNPKDTREAALAQAQKIGLTIPVMMDDDQLVGEQLGVKKTSEVFVINPQTWQVVYRGPLNGGKASATAALDAVIAGNPVAVASGDVKGKNISLPSLTKNAQTSFQKISYEKTIAPMIEDKCIACHEQGGIAPFAFDSYEKVKGFAPMIREAVRTDRMPPFDADPKVGHFKDDKSLSSDQIKTLVHWIEGGAPRGEGADPLTTKAHVAPEWPLGKPDMIVDIPSYQIPASGVVDYQYPTVANPLTSPQWLKASTTKVDQRQAVHHVLSGFIKEGSQGRGMAAWGSSVGGYTVGMELVVNPKGMATYMPTGGQFGFQMHYTPFGKPVTANTKVGLYFYKDGEKPDLIMREMPLVNQFIKIPPNDPAHKEVAYFNFPKDAILYTAVVHAHYRGTYSKLEIRYPSGEQKMIVNVPFYDFNWQRMYEFAEPIKIPAGSKVIATYIYDNSKRNPANPDPNKEIVWGDQSFEEMFYTSLRYQWVGETVANQTNYDDLLQQSRLMGMMDSNIDDKVQKDELRGQFAQLLGSQAAFDTIDANHDGGIDNTEMQKGLQMMQSMRRPAAAPAPAAPAAPAAAPGGSPTGGR